MRMIKIHICICLVVFWTLDSLVYEIKNQNLVKIFFIVTLITFSNGKKIIQIVIHWIYKLLCVSYILCILIDLHSLFFNSSTLFIIEIKHFSKLQTVFWYIKYWFFDQQQIWSDSCPVRDVDHFSFKMIPVNCF